MLYLIKIKTSELISNNYFQIQKIKNMNINNLEMCVVYLIKNKNI